MVKHRWISMVSVVLLICALPIHLSCQTTQAAQPIGPYARIAIFSSLDGHAVEWEAAYIRHLEWHRQAKDTWAWYSYSVWSTTDRQRSIIYATFGHSATDLNNPVSPAEDERDTEINILPHAHFIGNSIYEFLPALSRGTGVPTPNLRAEYTTVEVKPGASTSFEDALAAEQPKLRGETLWYRLVAGGSPPCYIRLRPRVNLRVILDERADQALPEKVNSLISKTTTEILNLRSNMLVNVTPAP